MIVWWVQPKHGMKPKSNRDSGFCGLKGCVLNKIHYVPYECNTNDILMNPPSADRVFTAPSPQVVYERLWADRLHLCVGPLPPGGTALGLCLDLVVFLPGRGLLLLLGPPLRSRYQTLAPHIKARGFKAVKCSLFKLFDIILAFFVDHFGFCNAYYRACLLRSGADTSVVVLCTSLWA